MSFRNFKLNRAIGLESQILTLLSPKFKRDYRKKDLKKLAWGSNINIY